jgi:hypothetical protein
MSFKRLQPDDLLISADSITAGAWSTGNPTLTEFYTSSVQEAGASGTYYLSVFQTSSLLSNAAVQFNIAFGNSAGSGSALYDSGIEGKSPTSTVFGQWQNIVLGDENNNFNFGGVTPVTQSIYALTVERSRYKGSMFLGTLDLRISASSGAVLQLTDNSNDVSTVEFNESGRVYQIISGSAGTAATGLTPSNGYSTASGSYGLFLPDIGSIILNESALSSSFVAAGGGGVGFTASLDATATNNGTLFKAISSSNSSNFTLNSQETITSDYVFIRAQNSEFNYSANPSFISGSSGQVIYSSFINAPQTFLTTVGLYNDNNELLATAKLSKPLKKDFTKEALIRVKLDF